jgi:Spy/CpxP family protein refolding chaperone
MQDLELLFEQVGDVLVHCGPVVGHVLHQRNLNNRLVVVSRVRTDNNMNHFLTPEKREKREKRGKKKRKKEGKKGFKEV